MARQNLAWAAATVAVAVAVTAGGFGYYAYAEIGAAIPAPAAFPEPRDGVEAVRVQGGDWASSSCAVGTVVPLRHVAIVVELGFAAGVVVQAGQVLVRLDTRRDRAALAAAQTDARLEELLVIGATGCVPAKLTRRLCDQAPPLVEAEPDAVPLRTGDLVDHRQNANMAIE